MTSPKLAPYNSYYFLPVDPNPPRDSLLTATLSGGGGGSGGFVISTTAPSDTTLMWIDSANGYFAKVWDGSAWVGISAAWG